MPIYTFSCGKCNKQIDKLFKSVSSASKTVKCSDCGGRAKRVMTAPGGYQMNSGGSSTRPRGAGSWRRK